MGNGSSSEEIISDNNIKPLLIPNQSDARQLVDNIISDQSYTELMQNGQVIRDCSMVGGPCCSRTDLPVVMQTGGCADTDVSCEGASVWLQSNRPSDYIPNAIWQGINYSAYEYRTDVGRTDECFTDPLGITNRRGKICILSGISSTENKGACCAGAINDSKVCGGWCPGNTTECRESGELTQYCSTDSNIVSTNCQQFCSNPNDRATWCDNAAIEYCRTKPTDAAGSDFCACINSELDGVISRPSCFDSRCNTVGYQTFNQINAAQDCGSICFQAVNCIGANTCNITENEFSQNCPVSDFPTNGETEETETNGDNLGTILIIIAVVVVLIIIIGIVAFFLTRRTPSEEIDIEVVEEL